MDIYSKLNLVRDTIDHLRDLLDAGGHSAHVDMSGWGDIPTEAGGDHSLSLACFGTLAGVERLTEEYRTPSCNTVACLAGWCYLNPDVRGDMKKNGHELSPSNVQDWLAAGYDLEELNGRTGGEAIHGELFHVAIGDYMEDDPEAERAGLLDELYNRVGNVEAAARVEDGNGRPGNALNLQND